MAGHSRRSTRFVAGLVAVTTMALGLPAMPTALATGEDPLATGIADWFTYLGGLADQGPLGSDLTGTTLNVGGEHGLDLAGLATALNGESWASATSADAVKSQLAALDGTDVGSWHVGEATSTLDHPASGTDRLAVSLTITRTVDTGLSLHDPSKDFDLSSPTGVSATMTLTLAFTAEHDATGFWIDHTTDTPSMDIAVDATMPTPANVRAAVGILGVTLAGSSFSLNASIDTTFADPNGDGRLAFDEGGSPGELAASGSAGGIATPQITSGSLSGAFQLTGESSDYIAGLPDLTATASVSADDLTSGLVTATFDEADFAAVAPFRTMTVNDLATALAQTDAALLVAERAQDTPLPLLHGSVADAVQAGQALAGFLKEWVQQPPTGTDATDPTKYAGTGHPLFASIQDLADKLHAYTDSASGAQITLGSSDATYDTSEPGKPKLRLTLHLSNHATTAIPLDVAGPALTGSGGDVTYGSDFLQDSSKSFTADVAGRQVVAGGASALIDHVDSGDPTKLILSTAPFSGLDPTPTILWQGGVVPDAGTAYSIAGQDPRTGQVEMADALKGDSGLANVNGSVPQAQITPHYDATLPLVLDLEPAVPVIPPKTVANDDGTSSIVSSRPTLPQRIMLQTGGTLLTANLPITTSVDATAKVGFLQVHVGGSLTVGTSSGGSSFLTIDTTAIGDSPHDVDLPTLFKTLADDPGSLLDVTVNGQVTGTLDLSVPGNDTFFPGGSLSATLSWPDITDPSGLSLSASGLDKLTAFDVPSLDDPTQLYGALLQALQSLDAALHTSGSTSSPLDTKLPLLGRSVHDLLGGLQQGGPDTTYTTTTVTDPHHDFTGEKGRRILIGSASELITDVSGNTATFAPALDAAPADGTPYALGDALLATLDALRASPAGSLNEMVDVLNSRLGGGVTFDVTSPVAVTRC